MLWYFIEAILGVCVLFYWLPFPDLDWKDMSEDEREVVIDELFGQQ
jgi:hypothetical protein